MTPEARRVLNFLASLPSGNSTVGKRDAHDILLETGGIMIARGDLYNIVAKHIGAGVYLIYLEIANPYS